MKKKFIKKIFEMSRNNDYTSAKLLDFAYVKKNYRLIATDLSKQTKLKDPQQISFIGNMKKKHWSINHSSINQALLQIEMV